MKHAIIIHGCPDSPEDNTYNQHWMPWVKIELEKQGYKVDFPTMPKPWAPSYNNFKEAFKGLTITPKTVLIGHSCGTAFLTHYLSENNSVTAKQLILVAPWKINHCNDYFRAGFYDFDISPTIKQRVQNITFLPPITKSLKVK